MCSSPVPIRLYYRDGARDRRTSRRRSTGPADESAPRIVALPPPDVTIRDDRGSEDARRFVVPSTSRPGLDPASTHLARGTKATSDGELLLCRSAGARRNVSLPSSHGSPCFWEAGRVDSISPSSSYHAAQVRAHVSTEVLTRRSTARRNDRGARRRRLPGVHPRLTHTRRGRGGCSDGHTAPAGPGGLLVPSRG